MHIQTAQKWYMIYKVYPLEKKRLLEQLNDGFVKVVQRAEFILIVTVTQYEDWK